MKENAEEVTVGEASWSRYQLDGGGWLGVAWRL
jgi:hypothetical protein